MTTKPISKRKSPSGSADGSLAPSVAPQPSPTPSGFEELLQSVLASAFATANYLARDSADAEDLVQEAALRAFTKYDTFAPGTNFKAWFLRILTNCFYMRHRQSRRQPVTVGLDSAPDLYLYSKTKGAGFHDDDAEPARTFMARLQTQQVTEAIRSLPDEFRVVTVLYFLEDRSYQEIATILKCPVGTVRSRLHRGRRLLQVALWRTAEDLGLVGKDAPLPRMPVGHPGV